MPAKHISTKAGAIPPITIDALKYCFDDVQCTFEIWEKLRGRYNALGISKPVSSVYSAASLGKGFYDDLGVPPFMELHPHFPPSILGCFMVSFYGGRSEVRIRNRPVEVIHTDFKSQYSTGRILLGLQDFLLAETFEIRCSYAPHFLHGIIRGATDTTLRSDRKRARRQLRRIEQRGSLDGTLDPLALFDLMFSDSEAQIEIYRRLDGIDPSSDGLGPNFDPWRALDTAWDYLKPLK